MTLRIGQIDYANCTPIFTALKAHFDCGNYLFVEGVPATLNGLLANGEIDLCPSSSIEYGKHPDRYYLLPHLSISSIGSVQSVLLYSRVPLEQLHNHPIGLTSESETSVNLLRILLARSFGLANTFERCNLPLREALTTCSALLLIGDAALKERGGSQDLYVYDLGELWYRFTGLPFVFALWIVRAEVVARRHEEVAAVSVALRAAKQLAYDSYEEIAVRAREVEWMGRDALVNYWRTISYDLTPGYLDGLRTFFRHAAEMGLLPREPEIRIFS